jgi:hypothetical protein
MRTEPSLLLFPLLGLDMRGVGKLLMQAQEQLFARDFGGELAHRQVGNLVFRIVPRPFRQALGEKLHHVLAARAGWSPRS